MPLIQCIQYNLSPSRIATESSSSRWQTFSVVRLDFAGNGRRIKAFDNHLARFLCVILSKVPPYSEPPRIPAEALADQRTRRKGLCRNHMAIGYLRTSEADNRTRLSGETPDTSTLRLPSGLSDQVNLLALVHMRFCRSNPSADALFYLWIIKQSRQPTYSKRFE